MTILQRRDDFGDDTVCGDDDDHVDGVGSGGGSRSSSSQVG